MTLLRAGRIASVASIEELMKAVRALKAGGGLPPPKADSERHASAGDLSAPVSAQPAAARATVQQPAAAVQEKTSLDRQAILDDPRLNGILKSMPGAKIIEIKEK
jgi:hypothetical protein